MMLRMMAAIAILSYFGISHSQNIGKESSPETTLPAIKAMAIMQTLNANLLASKSATQTLQAWCADHNLASPAKIIAQRDTQAIKNPDEEIRNLLKVSDTEPVVYRRVKLLCGDYVLSEADNWYVPALLTEEMNQKLLQTDIPFGAVVRPLNFHRQTERSRLLWNPLPSNWERQPISLKMPPLLATMPDEIFQHQAVLLNEQNIPFSVVIESYRKAILTSLIQ